MSHFFAFVRPLRGWLLSGISCLALAGCSASTSPYAADGKTLSALPQHQVADFLSVECADIWNLQSEASDKNPLYWLRGIDCADRLRCRHGRRPGCTAATAGRMPLSAAFYWLMPKLRLTSAGNWSPVWIASARKSPLRCARSISSGAMPRAGSFS